MTRRVCPECRCRATLNCLICNDCGSYFHEQCAGIERFQWSKSWLCLDCSVKKDSLNKDSPKKVITFADTYSSQPQPLPITPPRRLSGNDLANIVMEIRSPPLAPNLPSNNDHLEANKSNASCQTETTTCDNCCSNPLSDLSLLSLIAMRDKLELISKEISAIIDLRSRLNEIPPKSSYVNENQNQEIIINKSHPDKYAIVSCNKEVMKQTCIFQKFSYLGDNIIKSSSDLENMKLNTNECELKVKSIKISGHELTTHKGVCKFAWNDICKKGKKCKYLHVCKSFNVGGECKVSDCQLLHQKVCFKFGSGRCFGCDRIHLNHGYGAFKKLFNNTRKSYHQLSNSLPCIITMNIEQPKNEVRHTSPLFPPALKSDRNPNYQKHRTNPIRRPPCYVPAPSHLNCQISPSPQSRYLHQMNPRTYNKSTITNQETLV